MNPTNNDLEPSQNEEKKKTFEVEDFEQILEDKTPERKSSKIKSYLIILIIVAFFAALIFLLVFTLRGGFISNQRTSGSLKPDGKIEQSVQQKLVDQNDIKKFKNTRELEDFLQNNSDTLGHSRYYGMGDVMQPALLNESSGSLIGGAWGSDREMSSSVQETKSDDFSETNVQVEGVDEADIIKTDGEYVYALSNNELFLIKAYPATAANITSSIKFKDRPTNIYLGKNTLAVFGSDQQVLQEDYYQNYRRQSSYSFFKIYDIKDKKNPRLIKDLSFEGSYQNSRMIGDYVYFLTATPSSYIEGEIPVPRILDGDSEVFEYSAQNSTCKRCPEVFYIDVPQSNYQLISVSAINIEKPNKDISAQVYLLPHTQNMFVSLENLYLTYTKHLNENDLTMEVMFELVSPQLSNRNQEKIKKIQETETFILSPAEKQSKIMSIFYHYVESLPTEQQKDLEDRMEDKMKSLYKQMADQIETTVVHKINIDGNKLKYQGYGQVQGSVLNQFSMDEHGDFFRIATTKNRTWSRFASEDSSSNLSYNNIFVLDRQMGTVGALEGLARDERIYSVRFMQNRAYMVTFKQTDPLFVIDLKDPAKPRVLGMLKVPGFSNYLHPYDENLLIGLGKETEERSSGGFTTKGLKLSLFNVADVNHPVEVDKYVFDENSSNSIARNDHKAFLFSKEKNLLSIPVSMYEYASTSRTSNRKIFRGAYVFNIDSNGFAMKGKIQHSGTTVNDQRLSWCGEGCYSSTVRRSLFIDDVLYTYSDNYLKLNTIDDLTTIGEIKLQN